jgi:hypothetical protein
MSSRLKDASSVNKMTPNSSGCACIQWHKSIRWAWSHTWYADARVHSTSGQTWTSLNHLKNVLSCVNRSYHLPLREHSSTWKTTSVTQCLVNTSKYTSRRNPSVGRTPLVFFNSNSCTAIAKSIHKMHVTIFHVGKHKRHFSHYLQVPHSSYALANVIAFATSALSLKDGRLACAVYGHHVA